MTDPVPFLQSLVRAQKDGEAAVQRLVAEAARGLGVDEATLIACIDGMLEKGLLTRFGPLFDAGRLTGNATHVSPRHTSGTGAPLRDPVVAT